MTIREAAVCPYSTLAYARTLAHAGTPRFVSEWGTHVIVREFRPGVLDAIGTYPVACLDADSDLRGGLRALADAGLVSVVLVVDGLTGPPLEHFQRSFDLVRPFKRHHVVDPSAPYAPIKHHQDRIRRAARRGIEVRAVPLRHVLDEWIALYDRLVERHDIEGVTRFPRASFEALAACEGLTAVGAFLHGAMVSCQLWFEHDGVVWSHLAASSALAYANSATFAVYDHAIRHFAGRLIDLGGAAGLTDSDGDGLAAFKAGFANRTRMSHLCGAILDAGRYRMMCEARDPGTIEYFPAYRA